MILYLLSQTLTCFFISSPSGVRAVTAGRHRGGAHEEGQSLLFQHEEDAIVFIAHVLQHITPFYSFFSHICLGCVSRYCACMSLAIQDAAVAVGCIAFRRLTVSQHDVKLTE